MQFCCSNKLKCIHNAFAPSTDVQNIKFFFLCGAPHNRKKWLFSGSPSGAKAAAILYSLIETCKANNIEPYKYFCSMLHRIRLCKSEEDYRKLLPQFMEF
jgi:hypothetical protein